MREREVKNVGKHYIYENSLDHKAALVKQAAFCAHVQITGGDVHLTADYDNNFDHCVCTYQVS